MGGWLGGRPPRFTDGLVWEALQANNGNVSRAAQALRAGRSTVLSYLQRYPELRHALDELRAQGAVRVTAPERVRVTVVTRPLPSQAPADVEAAAPPAPEPPVEGAGFAPEGSSVDVPGPAPVDAPALRGCWLAAPNWAGPHWQRVRLLHAVTDKFYGDV